MRGSTILIMPKEHFHMIYDGHSVPNNFWDSKKWPYPSHRLLKHLWHPQEDA